MFPFAQNSLEPTFKKPYFHLYDQLQNPTISKNDDVSFLSNFPSPFFDEHELPLNQIFPAFTSRPAIANPTLESKDSPKPKQKPRSDAPPRRRSLGAVAAAPRKRTGKKDRHSKICTAQGIRDRRMRLSLQVARKFFDLQDLLGYDKASKTIEWLFTKSKKAIKELAAVRGGGNSHVSLSESEECEVMSGIEENCSNNEGLMAAAEEDGDGISEKKPKKTANTKESREKARARARCRTEEKMMGKRVEDPGTAAFNGGDLDRQERVSAADYAPLVHQQPSDVGTIEKLLGNSWDPNTNFMGFLGNWDLSCNQASNSMAAGNPNSIF